MKVNQMKANIMFAKMTETANKYGNVWEVKAVIYGQEYELNERQVRALQVLCKEAAERSEQDWIEFVNNVVVYNTHPSYADEAIVGYKPYCFHRMVWNHDGTFENEFDFADGTRNGFYNTCADLAFEMF